MKSREHRVLTVTNQHHPNRWPTDHELESALNQLSRKGFSLISLEYIDLSEDRVGVQLVMARKGTDSDD